MKLLKTIVLLSMLAVSFLHPKIALAACEEAAYCESTPGTCSPGTCTYLDSGTTGAVCKINTGYYDRWCVSNCTCRDTSGNARPPSCSTDGSFCGSSSSSDPYAPSTDYWTCDCQDRCESGPFTDEFGNVAVRVEDYCTNKDFVPCCNPGTPPPSGSPTTEICGNGVCSAAAGEDCNTCSSDCGSCVGGPVCGDFACNGGENCSSCWQDCGSCPPTASPPVCPDGICSGGETCSTCSQDCGSCLTCGDGSCNNGETCSTCAVDCGSCPPTCGDGVCTGFEDCENCPDDCGICLFDGNSPWWQAQNGLVFAGQETSTAIRSEMFSDLCVTPDCIALLIAYDSTTTPESEGVAITGGGSISTNGFTSTNDWEAVGSAPTRYQENFDYFYRNSGLGLNPTNDFTGEETDIQEPSISKEAYYHQGDLTLQSLWTVDATESYVVFVDGNLTISDPTNINQLTDVVPGGFLAFIVSGDILIEENVGNETLTSTTANLEGMFVANGTITIESRGVAGGGDDRFIGEGSFVGWTDVAVDRDYDDDAGRDVENQNKPAETFIFRPDLVENTPDILKQPHTIWQETN